MSSSATRLLALVLALGLVTAALVGGVGRSAAAADCRFVLGFQALHAMIPDTVGACVENEQHRPGQGVTHQRTTNGLLVWQKATNHTSFTDGYRTWISGPLGLQQRLNTERFDWERDLAAASVVPDDLAAFTQAYVAAAIAMYDEQGREATLAHYNDPASADGPWYVFVLEERDDGRLYSVANSNRPDLVGTTRERIDANGFNYGEAFTAVTETGGGEWVSYLFTHPETRQDALKHSWVVRRDNLLFGVGWYEGIE